MSLLPLLRARTLDEAGFAHGFTTRWRSAAQREPEDTLDFAVLRDPARLAESQARLAEAAGFEVARLHQAMQVHGADVLVAAGDPAATLAREADALVARGGTGDAVAVRVADCVPVLLADPSTGAVAAVHAGWRGVVGGVLGAALTHLSRENVLAAIGPSIGPCCFEVGEDVGERIGFVSGRSANPGKVMVDLRRAVRAQLSGCAAVEDVPGCTRCEPGRFHSYRRDGDASGRLIAVIRASL